MRGSLLIVAGSVFFGLADHALADRDVDLGTWMDADSSFETSAPLARALAQQVAKKLHDEKSKRIFLSVQVCQPSIKDDVAWCKEFESSLAAELVRNGVQFLGEAEGDEVRRKIAQEQMYQQNSMQVDVSKAVELGKQRALQAFMTVSVTGASDTITAAASSVNIRDGVVTVTERARLKMNQSQVRTWTSAIKGLTFMTLGAVGTAGALIKADEEKKAGDKLFKEYKDAATAEDATAARRKSEAQDKKVNILYGAASVAAVFGIYGYYSYNAELKQSVEYRIDLSVLGPGHGALVVSLGW